MTIATRCAAISDRLGFADPSRRECDHMNVAWNNASGGLIGSHGVEVRLCYRFTTLFNLHFALPGTRASTWGRSGSSGSGSSRSTARRGMSLHAEALGDPRGQTIVELALAAPCSRSSWSE